MIRKEKLLELRNRMEQLGITEDDLEEKFILGSGKGGQKLQKTYSCVYLKHKPTKLKTKCQKTRARELNRYYARKIYATSLTKSSTRKRAKSSKTLKRSAVRKNAVPESKRKRC